MSVRCEFCGVLQSTLDMSCSKCGAPLPVLEVKKSAIVFDEEKKEYIIKIEDYFLL